MVTDSTPTDQGAQFRLRHWSHNADRGYGQIYQVCPTQGLHRGGGADMILRAAQIVKFLTARQSYPAPMLDNGSSAALLHLFRVNLSTADVQGFYNGRPGYATDSEVPRNDAKGTLLVDVAPDNTWTFGFLVGEADNGDNHTVTTAANYLSDTWDLFAPSPETITQDDDPDLYAALILLTAAEESGHRMDQDTADSMRTRTRDAMPVNLAALQHTTKYA